MRAYITIQMDRPILKDEHYISIGGYQVTANNKQYSFDFNEYYGYIDKDNPDIIHFRLRDEDYDTFPEIKELRDHLHEITNIDEFYIYTGETYEPEIIPVKLLEFIIIDSNIKCKEDYPQDSEFVNCKVESNAIIYTFTEKLLNTCKF